MLPKQLLTELTNSATITVCIPATDGRCFSVARSVTLSTLSNLADRNRICLNGETPNDVQAGQWQTSFSRRGNAHLWRTVNKFQRPSILQLNIEGLTASKMSVLHHLALQCEALVILLQETHCTLVERLDLPSYHLAGFSLSRKQGLATFVHERLKWILIDQSPPTSEIEWVCVDVDNYIIVNVYKPLQHGCKHLIFQHCPIPASMLATATMLTGL